MEILKDTGLVQWLLGLALAYVIWTFQRSLKKFDEGQLAAAKTFQELFESVRALDRRMLRVETVHDVKGCNKETRED